MYMNMNIIVLGIMAIFSTGCQLFLPPRPIPSLHAELSGQTVDAVWVTELGEEMPVDLIILDSKSLDKLRRAKMMYVGDGPILAVVVRIEGAGYVPRKRELEPNQKVAVNGHWYRASEIYNIQSPDKSLYTSIGDGRSAIPTAIYLDVE